MQRDGDGEVNRLVVGGVAQGDRWTDPRGNEYVVAWVRKLGVLGYRAVDDSRGPENVTDLTKFVQQFRPTLPKR